FTLPTDGSTVIGTYTWTVTYSGDGNNNTAVDQGGTDEEETIVKASPELLTTASPEITLGTTAPTLSDTAVLSGAFNPTGSIVFTLTGPGGAVIYTQTDTVDGNRSYTATSTPLPTTGLVAGLYTWTAVYEGDGNNDAVADQGGPD